MRNSVDQCTIERKRAEEMTEEVLSAQENIISHLDQLALQLDEELGEEEDGEDFIQQTLDELKENNYIQYGHNNVTLTKDRDYCKLATLEKDLNVITD